MRLERTSADAAELARMRTADPWRQSSNTSSPPAWWMPWRAATSCRSSYSRFLFGAACAAIGDKARPPWCAFCEALAEVMFRYTRYVMYLAPLGVGAAIAVTVGSKGFGVLFGLGKLILTMYAAQVIFVSWCWAQWSAIARIPVARVLSRRRRSRS